MLNKSTFWIGAFLVLFILTQDYLFVSWSNNISILGLPNWMGWFMGIHVVFVLVFYVFTKKYWRK